MPTNTVSSDVRIHYEDTGGTGRPVVLIHGWPLSSVTWDQQVSALSAAGYRVVRYDRRGFGDSDAPLTGYGFDRLADDLDELMTRLDLDDATLVGSGMGGGEVARYVSRHGQGGVHSVVLASAVTPYLLQTGDNPEGTLLEADAARAVIALATDDQRFYEGFVTELFSVDGQLKATEQQSHETLSQCRQANRNASVQCMAGFGATDFRRDLRSLTVPVLVLHGDYDTTVPLEGSGRRTHEAIPGSELVVIKGGPHGINVTHAGEFNRVLLEFLAR